MPTLKNISHWKWMNQNFLVKFIRILKITEILFDTIFLIKSTKIFIFNDINQNSIYYFNENSRFNQKNLIRPFSNKIII